MKKSSSFERVFVLRVLAATVTASFTCNASAGTEFEFGDGWQGTWSTTASAGTSWRASDRDPRLYGQANGAVIGLSNGQGNNTIDEGNLNYAKGDRFSTLFKVISEVGIQKGDMGAFVRAKAWYDYTLNKEDVHFGNQSNGYRTNHPLSDKGFDPLLKFQGASLLDAYVYKTFQNDNGNNTNIRLGKQVLNWGESVFIQGVNQINPIDVPAARRPGAEVKEVLMPVWMISGSQSLGGLGSLEGFYQFKWEPSPIEAGCGNYWAVAQGNISANPGTCFNATSLASGSVSTPASINVPAYAPTLPGMEAKNSGQFGLAFRTTSAALDTEFGFYAMNIHARTPVFSLKYGNFPGTGSPLAAFWEYPENEKIFGISGATNLLGWSVSGELSQTRDFRAQLDGNDMFYGSFGVGPLASRAAPQVAANGALHGGVKTNKNQLQVSVLKAGNNFLAAQQWAFLGEIGYQWNNLPMNDQNNPNALRFNRPFIFGPGPNVAYGGANTCGTLNISPDGCALNQGYVTRGAWGYRLYVHLQYNDLFGSGVTVIPRLYWAQDVKGYSVDGQFLEKRTTLGPGVKFVYDKQYTLDFGYTRYGKQAKFDPLRDRDYFSANLSVAF